MDARAWRRKFVKIELCGQDLSLVHATPGHAAARDHAGLSGPARQRDRLEKKKKKSYLCIVISFMVQLSHASQTKHTTMFKNDTKLGVHHVQICKCKIRDTCFHRTTIVSDLNDHRAVALHATYLE